MTNSQPHAVIGNACSIPTFLRRNVCLPWFSFYWQGLHTTRKKQNKHYLKNKGNSNKNFCRLGKQARETPRVIRLIMRTVDSVINLQVYYILHGLGIGPSSLYNIAYSTHVQIKYDCMPVIISPSQWEASSHRIIYSRYKMIFLMYFSTGRHSLPKFNEKKIWIEYNFWFEPVLAYRLTTYMGIRQMKKYYTFMTCISTFSFDRLEYYVNKLQFSFTLQLGSSYEISGKIQTNRKCARRFWQNIKSFSLNCTVRSSVKVNL